MAGVDCPGCFAVVLPRGDGTCPSCGADTRSESPLVRMEIGEGTALPELCASCAASATRRVKVVREREGAGQSSRWLASLLSLLGFVTGVFLFGRVFRLLGSPSKGDDAEGQVDDVRLAVPMCEACAKAGPPRVIHSDFGLAKLSLVVHRDFRRAAKKLRRRRKG